MRIKAPALAAAAGLALLSPLAASAEPVTLTSDQIKAAVAGKTLIGTNHVGLPLWVKFGDGTAWVRLDARDITMTFEVKNDKFCRTVGSSTACQTVKRDGETLTFYGEDGSLASTMREDK